MSQSGFSNNFLLFHRLICIDNALITDKALQTLKLFLSKENEINDDSDNGKQKNRSYAEHQDCADSTCNARAATETFHSKLSVRRIC